MSRSFRLLLPGATLGDRLVGCLAAAVGIAGMGVACAALPLHAAPLIVAPMGASAVLLFAVPASPLAQPWPVVGGNLLAALVGVAVAKTLGTGFVGAGVAVGLAILVMSLARCLHPPGGAAALSAVIGGPAVVEAGWRFALVPVGINAVALLAFGLAFHRLYGRRYPHRAAPAPVPRRLETADLDQALAEAGEAFDIAREDLEHLLGLAEAAADRRRAAGGGRR
jgi:CBS domain-containing membrane protein